MTTAIATMTQDTIHPGWEPVMSDLVTSDGVNLSNAYGIGKRLLRRSDNGAPVAVVGSEYTILSNAAMIGTFRSVVDAMANVLGEPIPDAAIKGRFGRVVTLSLALPESLAHMLDMPKVDPSKRAAGLTLRSSHDGSYAASLSFWIMRLLCSNGMVGAADILRAKRKHTSGVVFLPQEITASVSAIPDQLSAYATGLTRLASMHLTRDSLELHASKIAGEATRATSKIIDMVLTADGKYVPTVANGYSALQLLEASTAYDRHFRTIRAPDADHSAIRLNRMIDREGLGAKAWEVLNAL